MAVYLDDEQVQLEGVDLASVLASAKDRLAPSGRVVVEVHVDGQPVVGDDLDEKQQVDPLEAELRLYSADPRELAVATLQQVQEKLDDAAEAQLRAAELFQQDQQNEAMAEVGRAVTVWQQLQQAVLTSSQLLDIDFDTKTVDDQSVSQITDGLLGQLRSLREMLSSGDSVALADALAYEWPETVERWDRFIAEMIRWIEEGSDDSAS